MRRQIKGNDNIDEDSVTSKLEGKNGEDIERKIGKKEINEERRQWRKGFTKITLKITNLSLLSNIL